METNEDLKERIAALQEEIEKLQKLQWETEMQNLGSTSVSR